MMAFDTSILSLAIDDSRSVFIDPKTEEPIECPGDRVRHLLWSLSKDKETILLPAPVIAELLSFSKDAMENLFQYLGDEVVFQFASFDYKAAVETARAMRERKEHGIIGDSSEVNVARNKIKVDYQIVAIALT